MAPFVRRKKYIFSLCLCDIVSIMSASIDSSPKIHLFEFRWSQYMHLLLATVIGHGVWQFVICQIGRDQLKRDGTRAETRFRLSAKQTSPFKSAGASVQSFTGSRGVSISGSNAGYTMFRGSVKGTGYPLHLNQQGRQFSRLLAAEVCASVVVMLDTPCSEVV